MSVADDTTDPEIEAEAPVVVHWQDDGVTAYLDECLRVLRTLPANSIHAVVTDPPYGLEFMGAEWDKFGDGPKPAGARIRGRSTRDAEPGAAHNGSTFMVARNVPESYSTGAGQRGKPGIGDRPTDWPSNQGWNGFRCRNCHHLAHGGSPCKCDNPDFARADGRWNAYQAWCEAWAAECYRVMIPGAWLVAFGGPRTVHRLTCGIEDAGFEIKDLVPWLFGQGFPKSKNAGRAVDMLYCGEPGRHYETQLPKDLKPDDHVCPEHPEGDPWRGWGTAFKPANEPIVIARKPLTGTLARNLLEHGTGALNIDAGRVTTSPEDAAAMERANTPGSARMRSREDGYSGGWSGAGPMDTAAGRWPPNVVFSHSPGCQPAGMRTVRASASGKQRELTSRGYPGGAIGQRRSADHEFTDDVTKPSYADADGTEIVQAWDCAPGCPVAELDAQSGGRRSAYPGRPDKAAAYAGTERGDGDRVVYSPGLGVAGASYADAGGASRFFHALAADGDHPLPPFMWNPKASTAERPRLEDGAGHSTVKPLALMRLIVKLVCPPGGTVLDLFAGSGTLGEAAIIEGFPCILIEQLPKHMRMIIKRLSKAIQPVLG